MTNVPRGKGTFAESAVVGYLQENGWPYAERRSLRGIKDMGDVTGCPGLCIEVKYAGAGLRLAAWLAETGIERLNANAKHGILVIKPSKVGARNVGRWYTAMLGTDFERLLEESLETPQAYTMAIEAPINYTAGTLREGIVAMTQFTDQDILRVLTFVPKGAKGQPGKWYRVMTLEHMVRLLRAAGYGESNDDTRSGVA